MSRSRQDTFERNLWAWIVLAAIGLTIAGRLAPLQWNLAALYVVPVLLGCWSKRRDAVEVAATVSTCLIVWTWLGRAAGVGEFCSVVINQGATLSAVWMAAFLGLRRQRQSQRQLQEALGEKDRELAATRDIAVQILAKVADSRDLDTGRHLERICAYSLILADELRKSPAYSAVIDDEFLTSLRQASLLHDIGKVAIRDQILQKPGKLTAEERNEMQQHTVIGTNILDDVISHHIEAGFLKMAAVIARYHHERFDGKGYPVGLSGKAIPLSARIVALADVYDALTSERPYKEAFAPNMARKMIEIESGKQFDPDVVDAMLRRFSDFVAVQLRYPCKHVHIFGLTEALVAEYCS